MSAGNADHRRLGDFATNPRVLVVALIAVVVGSGGVLAGVALLRLIRLVHQPRLFRPVQLRRARRSQHTPLGLAAVLVPVAAR